MLHCPLRLPFLAGLAILTALAACTPVGPPVELVALPPPPPPLTIVDPPVQPGSPVAVVRGAEPRPVAFYAQPARLSAPGEPMVLPPPIPHGDRQETLVEAVPASLVIGNGAFDQRRLVAFLNQTGRGRFDALHLEIRSPSRGAARSAARIAIRAGVDPLKIRSIDTQAASGRGSAVEVIATRYVATAPVCPSLAVVGPSVNDNDFEPTLGCSNRGNLAAMVNDPADLVTNDAVVPADGARASAGIERYRAPFGVGSGRQDGNGRDAPSDAGTTGYGVNLAPPGGAILGAGGPVSR